MRNLLFFLLFLIATISCSRAQSQAYSKQKAEKIAKGSVFTKIINREIPADIVYEDDEVISFVPLRKQARIHFLIVPKKEIYTVNDLEDQDALLMGKMMLVAKALAEKYQISETGYRLSINTNEDSGQSVFHIHLHLLGGNKLGPMVDRID